MKTKITLIDKRFANLRGNLMKYIISQRNNLYTDENNIYYNYEFELLEPATLEKYM